MRAAGRFVKHFAGLVDSFRLTRDFGDHIALQHIGQDKTRMMVCLADTPRRIRNLADRHLPILQCDVRKVVLEYGTAPRRVGFVLSVGRGLREQRENRGKSVATSRHDYRSYPRNGYYKSACLVPSGLSAA